jgi:hypothetical protein
LCKEARGSRPDETAAENDHLFHGMGPRRLSSIDCIASPSKTKTMKQSVARSVGFQAGQFIGAFTAGIFEFCAQGSESECSFF